MKNILVTQLNEDYFGIIYEQRGTKTNNLKANIFFLPTSDFVAQLVEVPTHNQEGTVS